MVLQRLIEEGLLLVQGDPHHDLRFGFRCRLLSSFDEIDGARNPRSGQIKRVKLEILAVEKVLPLWESCFPEDRSPHRALDLAKTSPAPAVRRPVRSSPDWHAISYWDACRRGNYDEAIRAIQRALADGIIGEQEAAELDKYFVARRECGKLWSYCNDNLMEDHQDKINTIMVGVAASKVLVETLEETHPGCAAANDATTDDDIDPEERDASHYASLAYARGGILESGSDDQKRLEYWTWWLTSAVSDATTDWS